MWTDDQRCARTRPSIKTDSLAASDKILHGLEECLECQDHHFNIITWETNSTWISFAIIRASYKKPVVCINTLFQMEIQSSGAIMQASLILIVVLPESVFRMASFQALAASSMSFLLCNSSGVMNSSLLIFGS